MNYEQEAKDWLREHRGASLFQGADFSDLASFAKSIVESRERLAIERIAGPIERAMEALGNMFHDAKDKEELEAFLGLAKCHHKILLKDDCYQCWREMKLAEKPKNDLTKVNRVEVIDHTKSVEDGGGRAFTFWDMEGDVSVTQELQDDGRTLKVFINHAEKPCEHKHTCAITGAGGVVIGNHCASCGMPEEEFEKPKEVVHEKLFTHRNGLCGPDAPCKPKEVIDKAYDSLIETMRDMKVHQPKEVKPQEDSLKALRAIAAIKDELKPQCEEPNEHNMECQTVDHWKCTKCPFQFESVVNPRLDPRPKPQVPAIWPCGCSLTEPHSHLVAYNEHACPCEAGRAHNLNRHE